LLLLSGCSLLPEEIDETKDWSAQRLYSAAKSALNEGDYEGAVELISSALRLNNRVPVFHNNLGVALKQLGRLDDAAAAYRKALKLFPNYAESHNNLGFVYQEQGRINFHRTVFFQL